MKRKLAFFGALVATEDCGGEQCRAMEGLPMCGSWCQDGSSEVRQIETTRKQGGGRIWENWAKILFERNSSSSYVNLVSTSQPQM